MLREFFGEWGSGRVGRQRYVILAAIVFGLALLLGYMLQQGNLLPVDDSGRMSNSVNSASPLLAGILLLVLLALQIALLNLIGKRARDAGLPGVLVMLAFVVLSAVSFVMQMPALVLATAAIVVLLAFIPTGQFSKKAA